MDLDEIDLQILALLQCDASISTELVSQHVGVSKTPCWRRMQRLEKLGYVKKKVALLDADKLDLGVSVFVQIKTNRHDASWAEELTDVINDFPEVVEFYRMAGEYDYLLRVLVKDISAYDEFYKKLIRSTSLTDVTSNFAMEQIKYTTEVPLAAPKI